MTNYKDIESVVCINNEYICTAMENGNLRIYLNGSSM